MLFGMELCLSLSICSYLSYHSQAFKIYSSSASEGICLINVNRRDEDQAN